MKHTYLKKHLLILAITITSLLEGMNPVLAGTTKSYAEAQNFTVNLQSKTMKEVFDYIEHNSEFVFLYYENMLDLNHKVTINIKNRPVTDILDQLFKGTNLAYVIEDRQIVITNAKKASVPAVTQQKKFMLQGKVLDDLGQPLPGAAVMIVGSTRGVTTDLDGSFEIEVIPSEKLNISYLGMQDQTISISDQKIVAVKLLPKVDELQEVTVVAFGKQTKASVIGAITTIGAEGLKMPVAKLSTSLAGQLAGIVSMQRSGEPGAGADFWIRGVNTFGANNQPLVLVDGIERSMDLVDAEDIATFSILKDATATALYGVRGANGIVLITTKRGKEAVPTINARVEYGIASPIRMPELASGAQWIDYYNDLSLESQGRLAYQPEMRDRYINNTDPDLYPNVDWINLIFKNVTTSTRANVNVTGGGKKVRYYVGGSFYHEGGVFNPSKNPQYDPSVNYTRFNFRTNIDIDVTSSTELGLSLSNQYETKNRLGVDMGTMYDIAITTTPISVVPVYSDGTKSQSFVGSNPYLQLNETGYSQDFNNNAQSLISLTQDFSNIITPGLKANVKFAWDAKNESTQDKRKNPSTYYATGRDADGNLIFHKNRDGNDYLSLATSNRGSHTMNLEASATYERVFNNLHRVGGLFLFNMREYKNNFPANYIAAFPNRNMGIAGRATYSYMDKYFGEFNFGYNGSENFAPGKQFGFFPSFAIGYMISNEKYFEKLLPVINLLKLKASYGEIGNDKIGGDRRFAFNSEMSWTGNYYFGRDQYRKVDGIATGHPGNPNVSWETAKKADVGIELGLFNKLKLQIDYFQEKRDGIYIQQKSVPSVVGINVTQYVNLGKMKNQGVDLSLEYEQTINDWYISGRANFTFNRNQKLYDDAPTPNWPYRSEVGFPLKQQRGLIALGLFESEADIVASPKQTFGAVRPGDIKYRDINSDGIIDENDEVAIGRTDVPEINYGFGISARYKGFDASVFFQGVGNVTNVIASSPVWGGAGNILTGGQLYGEVADNRWKESNPDPDAKYPRLSMSANKNNQRNSTFWLRDMSFLRLKNAEIGYTLPKKLTKKVGLSIVRVYAQGVNLLTFSGFKLWDPESNVSYGNVYPQMRTVNFGLNINF